MPITLRYTYKPHYNQNNLIMETDPTLVLYLPNPNILKQNNDLNPYIWPDYSNYGHHGTIYGATWTEKGLAFDGIDDYVQVENTVQLSGMNSFTVAAWICPTKTSEGTIVSKSDNTYNKEWILYINPYTFKYHFQVFDQQAGTFAEVYGSVVESGKRCFLIGTFDGSVVKIYENGTLRNQRSTDVIIRSLTAPIRVGNRADNARFYEGVIDEVRIYSRALSDGEISALYQNGVERFYKRMYL